jgi:hypothetical protein
MKLKKYYQANAGFSGKKAEMLKGKIYTMPLAEQKQGVTFPCFL